ncbi:hypothetical protein, partial [Nonomuraea sp. NPDC050783]|uniref:hypothetical protein n=1 Tax=Nonomuraea sp. NPDC050783 TaxID=3154634 RepID=UPI00346624B3
SPRSAVIGQRNVVSPPMPRLPPPSPNRLPPSPGRPPHALPAKATNHLDVARVVPSLADKAGSTKDKANSAKPRLTEVVELFASQPDAKGIQVERAPA